MRPLNRPMFRYGGPIKEGVMSGIREPHAGGRIGFKDGTKKKTYEFSETPAAKATSGFVHYGPYAGIAGAYDLAAVPINTLSRMFGYNPGFSGTKFMDTLTGGEFSKRTGYDRDKAWFGVPTSAKKGWTIPSMKEGPTAAEIELAKLKKQLAEQEKGTMSENLVPEVPKKSAEEIRAERIQKYRDIMDIKGMNKQAAYKSLIDASKLIQESGDFKGDIKSGKLINDIIQSTSKQFEKPAKTKDAIDTLILKGEIEKDIKASDPSNKMLNELRLLQGKKITEELNPSFTTLKAVHSKAGKKGQSGIDDAASEYATNNGVDFKGNIISKSDFSETLKDLKEKTGGLDEDVIITNWTNEIIKGKNTADGAYTVGDKIVIIKDSQVISVE